ncbi:MAG TPA: response regulator, partial [Nitrospira sp.]
MTQVPKSRHTIFLTPHTTADGLLEGPTADIVRKAVAVIATIELQSNVLIVDDDPKDIESLANSLREVFADCSILTARNAGEALDLCQCQEIDCVILDLDLDDSSGFDVLLGLNPNRERPTKAVVILTRLLTPNLHEMTLYNGAHACLIKQCTSPRQLSDCIRKAIEVCGLHRQTEVARHFPVEQDSTYPSEDGEERGIPGRREIHK